jgi:copper chaperone CopZ
MKTLKFQTNVKCGGCVATITPFLNQEKGIARWNVDLASPQRILAVETEEMKADQISEVMKAAGYQAELIDSENI